MQATEERATELLEDMGSFAGLLHLLASMTKQHPKRIPVGAGGKDGSVKSSQLPCSVLDKSAPLCQHWQLAGCQPAPAVDCFSCMLHAASCDVELRRLLSGSRGRQADSQ